MKIGIGNDHAAVALKNELTAHLKTLGHEVFNYGTDTSEAIDYPVIAKALCNDIGSTIELGILVCGTGMGMSIAANKLLGIRAALCGDPFTAQKAKEHNDANVLCLGARVIGSELAKMIVDSWLTAEFLGGKYQLRNAMFEEWEK